MDGDLQGMGGRKMNEHAQRFVNAIKNTENARREYHLAEAAGASTEELLKLAKKIIHDATGDGSFNDLRRIS